VRQSGTRARQHKVTNRTKNMTNDTTWSKGSLIQWRGHKWARPVDHAREKREDTSGDHRREDGMARH